MLLSEEEAVNTGDSLMLSQLSITQTERLGLQVIDRCQQEDETSHVMH